MALVNCISYFVYFDDIIDDNDTSNFQEKINRCIETRKAYFVRLS